MVKKNLGVSLKISLGLTSLSYFLGWLHVFPYDETVPIIPIPLQLLRIFVIVFLSTFIVFILSDYLKIQFLKFKKHDK